MTALYVLGAILVVLVLGVMVAPLFREEAPAEEIEALPPAERREAALEAVRDLQFEHETGKMGEEEFRRLRAHFGRIVIEAEEELEAAGEEVAGGREARASLGQGDVEASAEAGPASCPECGEENEPGVRFCPRCGARQPGAGSGGEGG